MPLPLDTAGLGPDDQHVIGAIDIGHRHQHLMAEHVQRCQHVGQLVDRGRRVQVLGAQVAKHQLANGQKAQVVRGRVALVHGQGVLAVALADLAQASARHVEGLVPRDGLEPVPDSHERCLQAVLVVVNVDETDHLWAHVALAERIVRIATHVSHLIAFYGQGDATDGLTEVTASMMQASSVCGGHGSRWARGNGVAG